MAFNKRNNSGLDLSGVGSGRIKLGGSGRINVKGGSSRGATGRSAREANRQMGSSLFSPDPLGHKPRNMVLVILGVVLALALAIGVGVFVYQRSMQDALKPELSPGVDKVLVAEEEGQVIWSLLAINSYTAEDRDDPGLESCALLSIDPDNLKVTFLWIPAELRVYVAGYGYRSLSEAYVMESDETFVQVCADVTGVSLSHYLEFTKGGMADYLGKQGLDASLAKEQAAAAVVKKLIGTVSEQLPVELELLDKYLATDLTSKELGALITKMHGTDLDEDIFNEDMPLEDSQTEEGYVQSAAAGWATMTKRISEGLDPVAGQAEISKSAAIRSNAKVTIWNGVGVSGIASDCAEHLKKKGWGLESTGNAASFVYEETLVVYTYDADRPMAELLVSDLGQGRAVRSAARYSFEGDILVVVGKDYQPY
ncbi:MAG: LCP family protein [Coriobacteriales bacterium]